jgi:dynein light chain LC8-type
MAGQGVKIKVLAVDMEDEMMQFAVSTATQAFESGRQEKEIANQIKRAFDNQYQYVWNCIVGRDFGSHIVHQTKRYIFMSYFDSVFVLLWKSN